MAKVTRWATIQLMGIKRDNLDSTHRDKADVRDKLERQQCWKPQELGGLGSTLGSGQRTLI